MEAMRRWGELIGHFNLNIGKLADLEIIFCCPDEVPESQSFNLFITIVL